MGNGIPHSTKQRGRLLISDSYREMNRQLHAQGHYGLAGAKLVDDVLSIAVINDCTTILDYGCGAGALKRGMVAKDIRLAPLIREYDPAISGKDTEPEIADLVVCNDVLEHIEPECLEDVLNHIDFLATKAVFLKIHCGEAKKFLPDGRNAHLIQEHYSWWLPKLWGRWTMRHFAGQALGFGFVGVSE